MVVVTQEGGPLAEAADVAFTGKSDLFMQLAAYALLRRSGVERDWALLDQALDALPEALVTAAHEGEERARVIAETLKDEPITYVLGSGPSYAWAYGLAMCFLQEMQWKHAAGFNSGEFFQGAFEVVNDDVAVINLLGEDPSRAMAERAMRFLDTYATKKTFHIDTADLTLPGVPKALRGEVSRWRSPCPWTGWPATTRPCAGTTSTSATTCSRWTTDPHVPGGPLIASPGGAPPPGGSAGKGAGFAGRTRHLRL